MHSTVKGDDSADCVYHYKCPRIYSSIALDTFESLLFSKTCYHNLSRPRRGS